MIYYHADDFGIAVGQNKKILECARNGKLNSISIIPNTNNQKKAFDCLTEYDPEKKIRRVLHLNFVEGFCLADPKYVTMLVGKDGKFNKSFIDIWKWNFTLVGEKRFVLKQQLKEEIKAQFESVVVDSDFGITAIDSHQHYHMIPIVFDSMMEVIQENYRHQIKEIRVPLDSLQPLLTTPFVWRYFRAINLVKWIILKPLCKRNKVILQKCGIAVPEFFGITFTCEMRYEVVRRLLPKYEKIANKNNKDLELMFHPGSLDNIEELLERNAKELEEFYFSPNRSLEAECLKQL